MVDRAKVSDTNVVSRTQPDDITKDNRRLVPYN